MVLIERYLIEPLPTAAPPTPAPAIFLFRFVAFGGHSNRTDRNAGIHLDSFFALSPAISI